MTGFYDPHSLANILSFKEVANIPGVYITMDTLHEKAITITLLNNTTIKFTKCADGLYFFDPAQHNFKNKSTDYFPMTSSINTQLISTVKENKTFFTNQDILLANKAR